MTLCACREASHLVNAYRNSQQCWKMFQNDLLHVVCQLLPPARGTYELPYDITRPVCAHAICFSCRTSILYCLVFLPVIAALLGTSSLRNLRRYVLQNLKRAVQSRTRVVYCSVPHSERQRSSTQNRPRRPGALDVGGRSTPRPGRFFPGKESLYPLYRRVGLR